jgi:hypothetical protein
MGRRFSFTASLAFRVMNADPSDIFAHHTISRSSRGANRQRGNGDTTLIPLCHVEGLLGIADSIESGIMCGA